MNNTQQPPLPTLQPGDSHMESLIEAAIQGHADTRDAMRWLVRQLVPATQPAEVTAEQIFDVLKQVDPEAKRLPPGISKFARAILALRPVQVPMTDEVRERALDLLATLFDAYENGPACYESPDDCSGYLGNAVQIDHDTFHVIASLLNVHRPITAQAKKETP